MSVSSSRVRYIISTEACLSTALIPRRRHVPVMCASSLTIQCLCYPSKDVEEQLPKVPGGVDIVGGVVACVGVAHLTGDGVGLGEAAGVGVVVAGAELGEAGGGVVEAAGVLPGVVDAGGHGGGVAPRVVGVFVGDRAGVVDEFDNRSE